MVGFGSLWTFSSGLYCFFFTLHFSVPEILLYIKTPVYCRLHTNFALITVQKVFFPPAVFSLFLHVYAIFAMFLGVFSQLFLSQGYAIPLYGMIFLNTESATLCRFRQAEQK